MSGTYDEPGQDHPARVDPRSMNSVYRRRRLTVGGISLAFLVGLTVLLAGMVGGSSVPSPHKATAQSVSPTSAPAATTPSSSAPPTPAATTDPGLLPQTSELPPSDVAAISSRMAPLWTAMQTASLPVGMAVFFPKSAYLQAKTGSLANLAADYQGRLVAQYGLDLNAYSSALGVPPTSAVLVGFAVEPSLVHWVPPGACANVIGYWHLPNIRISYSSHGSESSFGVFSLISWRGVWYVVHLGPVPRISSTGSLDRPADGQGTPGPGGGC